MCACLCTEFHRQETINWAFRCYSQQWEELAFSREEEQKMLRSERCKMKFVICVFGVLLYSQKVHTHASTVWRSERRIYIYIYISSWHVNICISNSINRNREHTNKKWMNKNESTAFFARLFTIFFFYSGVDATQWRDVWISNEWLCITTNLRSSTHNNKNDDQFETNNKQTNKKNSWLKV